MTYFIGFVSTYETFVWHFLSLILKTYTSYYFCLIKYTSLDLTLNVLALFDNIRHCQYDVVCLESLVTESPILAHSTLCKSAVSVIPSFSDFVTLSFIALLRSFHKYGFYNMKCNIFGYLIPNLCPCGNLKSLYAILVKATFFLTVIRYTDSFLLLLAPIIEGYFVENLYSLHLLYEESLFFTFLFNDLPLLICVWGIFANYLYNFSYKV